MLPETFVLPIIVNPVAGAARALEAAQELRRQLERRHFRQSRVQIVWKPEDVATAASEAVKAGAPVVAIAGGDGTLQWAARALAGTTTALAVVAAGRGNDLALALSIPRDAAELARLVFAMSTRTIDVGQVDERPFLTVASCGFDSEVAAIVYRRGVSGSGRSVYLMATLKALRRFRPVQVKLEGDFGIHESLVTLVATANTRSYGGGMLIAPDADPADGAFDVVVIGRMGRLAILRTLRRVYSGRQVRDSRVTVLRTKRLSIEAERPLLMYADGEPCGQTPATLELRPRALRVIAPRA